MTITRAITEYNNKNEFLNKEYILELNSYEILKLLGKDFELNDNDPEDELYDVYQLSENQVKRLKPYLKEPLEEDFFTYSYYLECFDVS